MNDIRNIYSSIPVDIPKELIQDILTAGSFKIERIVSKGHSSPEGFWYDQDQNEWVLLLKGSAGLMFEGTDEIFELKPGDYVNIPAHLKHRVEWTEPNTETVWVAVMY
jgi:cupin 2 domain-containing protein